MCTLTCLFFYLGSFLNTDDTKRIVGRALLDDSKEYSATAELVIEDTRYNTKYLPRFEVALHGKSPYKLGGHILYRPAKRADIDMALENVFSGPLTVKGKAPDIYWNRILQMLDTL